MKKLIFCIAVASLVTLGLCTSTTSPVYEQTESRKTSVRSPAPASGGVSLVNSLQSTQDGAGKPQTGAQTYSRQPTPIIDYNSVSSPHSTVYANLQGTPVSGQPTQPTTQGGNYLFAVNSHGSQYHMPTLTPLVTNAGPTPLIMQYLPTQTQSGGIQYLQLIPTRPFIVPINPYLSSPYNQNQYSPQVGQYHSPAAVPQYNVQPGQYASNQYNIPNQYAVSQYASSQYAASPYTSHSSNQYTQSPSSYNSQPNTHTLASAASTYPTIPNAQYHPPTTNSNYAAYQPTLQSPIGGYSTNVYTYFRPNAGVQMINSPLDLSLNTNEYVPLQGDSAYKMRRP